MTVRDNLVFVEVRQRTSSRFETPAETVNKRKHQHLQKAAVHYLQRTHRNNGTPYRVDVNTIEGDRANTCVDWIKNSF